MNRSMSAIVVLGFLAAGLAAQEMEMPKPAAELKKLERFVGGWEGVGTAMMVPGQPASKWTSQAHYQWALGGHWIQGDTTVKFEGMPITMQFREYLGWDGEENRYVTMSVSNMGEGSLETMNLVGDDLVANIAVKASLAGPQAHRASQRFTKDGIEFMISFLGADGASMDAVKGTMKKIAKGSPTALDAAHVSEMHDGVKASLEAMKKIARMCGKYEVKGEFKMSPEAAATAFEGIEEYRSILDGAVVQVMTQGQPGNYEAHGFFTYDQESKSYGMMAVDSMGMICHMKSWFGEKDRKVISIFAGPHMGRPTASRMVMELDANGRLVSVANHSLCGDSAPIVDFKATYTPAKK